ncbi:MAG: hypothetical protein RIT52_1572, partial [Pseudomonadota bacterium]
MKAGRLAAVLALGRAFGAGAGAGAAGADPVEGIWK